MKPRAKVGIDLSPIGFRRRAPGTLLALEAVEFHGDFVMLSNRLAFAALGIGCLAAAAAGGYVASRQNAVPVPASAATAVSAPAAPVAPMTTPERPAQPVQETEAVVGDTAKSPAAPVPNDSDIPAATPRSTRDAAPVRLAETPRGIRPAKSAQVARQAAPPLERTWPSGTWPSPTGHRRRRTGFCRNVWSRMRDRSA